MVHTFNPNTKEAEAGESWGVGGHPGLQREVLSQKKKKKPHPKPLYESFHN